MSDSKKIVYNKLVRDKIPEIIKKSGKDFKISVADEKQKTEFLEAKLKEEVNEYLEDKNLEELADVMEVLFGLADSLGFSEEDLINCRNKKRDKRGGFKEGIILEEVICK